MNDIVYAGKHLRTYTVQQHSHDTWELIYCTTGSGELMFTDYASIKYKTGDIVVIPPGVTHANCSIKGFTNIHININNATFTMTSPLAISDDSEKHIYDVFNSAFFYYNSQLNKKQLLLSAIANLLVSFVIAFQNNKPTSKIVETIKNDIVKNFPDCNFQLDKYLSELPFSYDYLRKLFKSEMGVTPHVYLNNMRMQAAEKMLSSMNQEYNVTKIAQMCGFEEPLYFSRVFKKEFGCSPINYAKQKSKK